jgi:hypothetical protein
VTLSLGRKTPDRRVWRLTVVGSGVVWRTGRYGCTGALSDAWRMSPLSVLILAFGPPSAQHGQAFCVRVRFGAGLSTFRAGGREWRVRGGQ